MQIFQHFSSTPLIHHVSLSQKYARKQDVKSFQCLSHWSRPSQSSRVASTGLDITVMLHAHSPIQLNNIVIQSLTFTSTVHAQCFPALSHCEAVVTLRTHRALVSTPHNVPAASRLRLQKTLQYSCYRDHRTHKQDYHTS